MEKNEIGLYVTGYMHFRVSTKKKCWFEMLFFYSASQSGGSFTDPSDIGANMPPNPTVYVQELRHTCCGLVLVQVFSVKVRSPNGFSCHPWNRICSSCFFPGIDDSSFAPWPIIYYLYITGFVDLIIYMYYLSQIVIILVRPYGTPQFGRPTTR